MGEVEHIKRACRGVVRARLAALDDAERQRQSRAVCMMLQTQPWLLSARSIMAFVPLPDEPDIGPLISFALARGIAVALPGVDWAAKTMTPLWIDCWPCALRADQHGVQVPCAPVAGPLGSGGGLAEPEVVLVPGLAFDERGRRLGRGGGFYDRYIQRRRTPGPAGDRSRDLGQNGVTVDVNSGRSDGTSARQRVFAAGIALEAHMLDAVPVGPHDQRLDAVVWPTRATRVSSEEV
ncbi:MAG: 5-formyltetrahydrofolate cyclo-ligase [Planctomycetota bacterium]|nr:5-formyltetrahydrofolate cyclo-ligase [Planctomycetota bacterium]